MRIAFRTWPGSVAVLLALAALPATPAELPAAPGVLPTPRLHAPRTATAVMPVTMEVAASCHVNASDLDFGAYQTNALRPALGETVIELRCGPGITAELLLDAGTGALGNTSRRQMSQQSGFDRMDYDLYQDAARRQHWGDRSGRDTVEVRTTGATQTVTVYGEIPAGQRVRDGTYSDVITLTVHY